MPTPNDHPDGLSRLAEFMRDEHDDQRVERHTPPPVDPVSRKKRRRRRAIIGGVVGVVVAALLAGYVTFTLTAPVGTAKIDADAPAVAVPAAAQVALSPEGASAISVSGADDYLGSTASGVWMSGGGDDARPIASISKLITTLVVLEAKPLAGAEDGGPTITFDKDDHALYDKYYVLNATIAAMPTGSSMSEHDALEMLLVISASNYAEAVSTWAYGSQSAFLRATKNWLATNGLAHTTIVEPTGIDARNTSTPSDLIALAKIAMANPVVARIVGMQQLDVPGVPADFNTNDLLGSDGITGIKTGTLDPSGSNLLFSATLDAGVGEPLTVIGVVLGGFSHESVDLDVRALLASVTAGFHDVPLGSHGDEIGTYSTPWGESAQIVLGKTATVRTWSDTPVTTTFTVDPLTTGRKGDQVGEITWTAGPSTVTAPLILQGDIEPPTAWWRLTHPFDLGG